MLEPLLPTFGLPQSLGAPAFPHQLAVDAYTAQHPGENPKPIRTPFALVGLYLVTDEGFTGRQVQRVHMLLDQKHRDWPAFTPPMNWGAMTALDVIRAEPGGKRLEELNRWVLQVWGAWSHERERVVRLVPKLS